MCERHTAAELRLNVSDTPRNPRKKLTEGPITYTIVVALWLNKGLHASGTVNRIRRRVFVLFAYSCFCILSGAQEGS